MLGYRAGDTLPHRLDARAKLGFQAAFAVAAFAHTTPTGLAALSVVGAGVLAAARLSPLRTVSEYRFLLPFLVAGAVVESLRPGPPWVVPAAAVDPLLAGYRVLLVVLVGAAYVRTTPVRESRAAVEWAVPGRLGRLLGTGVGLTFRFLPLLRRDLRAVRDAERARLGDQRPVRERMQSTATAGISRAFARADRLALALQARCFAWNPTLPPLRFERGDWVTLGGAACLLAWAVL